MDYPISFWSMSLHHKPNNPIFLGGCPACRHRPLTNDPEGIYFDIKPPVITVKCTRCGLAGIMNTSDWELIQGFFSNENGSGVNDDN